LDGTVGAAVVVVFPGLLPDSTESFCFVIQESLLLLFLPSVHRSEVDAPRAVHRALQGHRFEVVETLVAELCAHLALLDLCVKLRFRLLLPSLSFKRHVVGSSYERVLESLLILLLVHTFSLVHQQELLVLLLTRGYYLLLVLKLLPNVLDRFVESLFGF